AAALKLPAYVVMGFEDPRVNRLLSLDTEREVAFSMVSLGRTPLSPPEAPAEMPPLPFETAPLSRKEVDYPAMREMHEASVLASAEEVASWRGHPIAPQPQSSSTDCLPLRLLSENRLPRDGVEEVILRRGSSRVF